jgi:histidine triad (HIT) family protein
MPTLFTRIIEGELPGRFVWRDDRCVAFLTIAPLAPGHTMVVPIAEVDHWIDMDLGTAAHVFAVSQVIGRALDAAFEPLKIGVLIVGEEVPHAHIHLVPFRTLAQLNFANADNSPDPAALDQWQATIIDTLREQGHDPGV